MGAGHLATIGYKALQFGLVGPAGSARTPMDLDPLHLCWLVEGVLREGENTEHVKHLDRLYEDAHRARTPAAAPDAGARERDLEAFLGVVLG